MKPPRPVAVDAMGGDHAPGMMVSGAVAAARAGIPVVLVGDEARVRPMLPRGTHLDVVHAAESVGMEEAPTAIRRREEASVRRALRLVAEGEACAAISCGNTGAVLVAALLELGLLPGAERPAIATVLPRSDGGRLVLLDAGANVDCRPEQLASFALLGTAHARVLGVDEPRVGLLSNGEEASKGNEQVRAARPLLEALPIRFVGNVEPSAAFAGACDVLVCDGFVGNVMLKAVEGAADTVLHVLKDEILQHPTAKVGAWLLTRALKRFRGKVAWDAYGGGILLGTRGVVVVGHGRSNAVAVESAIALAWQASEEDLLGRIERRLARG